MAGYNIPYGGQVNYGKKTANAATAYTQLFEPMPNYMLALGFMQFTVSTTAHTAYLMRPLSFTTIASVAAAGQAVINITADPGTVGYYGTTPGGQARRTANNVIAAGDYCAYHTVDGTWVLDTVASVSTLAITMTSNVPTGGAAALSPFWFFGISTDTNPVNAQAQPILNLPVSSTVNFGSEGSALAGFFQTFNRSEPLMMYNANATAASIMERATALYLGYGSPYFASLPTPPTT